MNNIKEQPIWKPYPDYPFIEANQFGEIRTKDRVIVRKDGKKYPVKGRVLKQHDNGHGYMQVSFQMNGKTVSLSVHRVIAASHIPNPNNLPEVNHKDDNPKNNAVSNLEWCTREYNEDYKKNFGTTQAEVFGHPVFAVNLKTGKILRFKSQSEAARQLGIDSSHISEVVKGHLNIAGGYWFTEDESEITEEKIREIKANMLFLGGVIAVNPETSEVFRFKSQHEAGRKLGVETQNINKVVKGQRKTAGGYWFCYADENAVERTREKFGNEVANKVEKLMIEREQKA